VTCKFLLKNAKIARKYKQETVNSLNSRRPSGGGQKYQLNYCLDGAFVSMREKIYLTRKK